MPLLHDHRLCGCRHSATHGFTTSRAPRHYPPDLSIEPVHMEIALHVEVEQERASGHVKHRLKVNTPGARELVLDAVELEVFEVSDADEAMKLTWRHDGQKLTLTWPEGLEQGSEREVTIRYMVERPKSGLFFSKPDAAYPERARWACTDHETERARHWLPCVDRPQVRCELDFLLRAKQEYAILANGALVEETVHEDGTKTAHWRLEWPCPSYITCFALGEFSEYEDGEFDGKPIKYFAAKHHDSENLRRSFDRTGEMLGWITGLLETPLPYPKYYQFALPGIGGAMENISLVSWDDVFVLDETLAQEWGWLADQINIHEMAHSYFGDALVCRDFAHAWLKESWATYIESCWLEHKYGVDEITYDVYRNMNAYFDEADHSYKRPLVTNVYDTSWQMYDRHLYPGGGARLHMLRKLLGDEVFWRGVRDYVQGNLGKVVETHDFRVAMERASGRSLVRFFDQWIFSAGYPDLEVSFEWDEQSKEGRFTLTQCQADEEKRHDLGAMEVDPVFVFDLKIGYRIEGEDHVEVVHVHKKTHQHVIKMEKRPSFVRIDPSNELVLKQRFSPGDDMLLAQLAQAPDVVGRILAARGLVKTEKAKNIEAVAAHYEQEPFWGVRQQIVKALGESSSKAALDAVIRIAEQERDGLVLETVMSVLGSFKEERVVGVLLERLSQGLPYRARMVAYEKLGAQGDAAPYEYLVDKAHTPTFGAFPQTGALNGLAATRRAEALEVMLKIGKRAEGAAPQRVRAAAMGAIGRLAKYLEGSKRERAIDALVAALRDEDAAVAKGAAYGLVAARAAQARGALESFARRLSHQERIDLERAMESLSQSGEAARLKTLEEELDTLRKAHRELSSRVEKLPKS